MRLCTHVRARERHGRGGANRCCYGRYLVPPPRLAGVEILASTVAFVRQIICSTFSLTKSVYQLTSLQRYIYTYINGPITVPLDILSPRLRARTASSRQRAPRVSWCRRLVRYGTPALSREARPQRAARVASATFVVPPTEALSDTIQCLPRAR